MKLSAIWWKWLKLQFPRTQNPTLISMNNRLLLAMKWMVWANKNGLTLRHIHHFAINFNYFQFSRLLRIGSLYLVCPSLDQSNINIHFSTFTDEYSVNKNARAISSARSLFTLSLNLSLSLSQNRQIFWAKYT